MHTKKFTDYKEFLKFASEHIKEIKDPKVLQNRLLRFKYKSYNCSCDFESDVLTPNKFCKEIGIDNFYAFRRFNISTIKEFCESETDVRKWFGGYFGGLVGCNTKIVNDYVGTGEVHNIFDYDINNAYMKALTEFLPTKFVQTLEYYEYLKLNEFDKIPFIYFYEIKLSKYGGKYFDLFGKIKSSCMDFDFLNSKTNSQTIIVSEYRLRLIQQIYFKDYEIKKVYVFEKHKHFKFQDILKGYEKLKKDNPQIKQSGLALIGCFGKIWNTETTDISFKRNILQHNTRKTINWNASPQIAMFVADIVALRLFEIVQANKEFVLSWNTDGLTALKKLPLQISKKSGFWKCKNINALCFLESENGQRVFYKDIETNKVLNYSSINEINNEFWQILQLKQSSLKRGYFTKILKIQIKKTNKYDISQTFRNLLLREKFQENVLREYTFEKQ